MPTNKNTYKRRVLVTRFSALGDVVMTIPALYDVCRNNPDSLFVFVTKKNTAGVFVNAPSNLLVAGVDVNEGSFSGPFGMPRLFRALNDKYHFTDFADLHNVTRTKLLRGLAYMDGEIKTAVIDKDKSLKRAVLNRNATSSLVQLSSSFERYRNVFKSLGFDTTPRFTKLFDDNEPFGDISHIAPEKKEDELWIAIAPFAAHQGKVYPEEMMRKVIEQLAAHPGVRIFMFGSGDKERESIRRLIDGIDSATSLAEERLGFPTEYAMLRRMDVMLAMDSANMHLAAIAGRPVVSIWGQTHTCMGFAPWNQPAKNIIECADMICRPCSVYGNRTCHRLLPYACLYDIAPETVAEKVMKTARTKS